MKVSRTVWSGGKDGDYIKFLPIAINVESKRNLTSLKQTETNRYAWSTVRFLFWYWPVKDQMQNI